MGETMNAPAILFGIYLLIGMILMIVAVATPRKKKRQSFTWFGTGEGVDAALLIFVAALWPVWLLSLVAKKGPKE